MAAQVGMPFRGIGKQTDIGQDHGIGAKRGRAVVPMPGGCKFGTRPIDLHLRGLERLGAQFDLQDGCVIGTVPAGRLRGTTMYLGGPSGPTVLGTINIMSAAALAEGVTRIVGAACEPEVADCAALLNKMGARISGADGIR